MREIAMARQTVNADQLLKRGKSGVLDITQIASQAGVIRLKGLCESSSSSALLHTVILVVRDVLVEIQGEMLPIRDVRPRCTCTWSKYDGVGCSHQLGVFGQYFEQQGFETQLYSSFDEARQHEGQLFIIRTAEMALDQGLWGVLVPAGE